MIHGSRPRPDQLPYHIHVVIHAIECSYKCGHFKIKPSWGWVELKMSQQNDACTFCDDASDACELPDDDVPDEAILQNVTKTPSKVKNNLCKKTKMKSPCMKKKQDEE